MIASDLIDSIDLYRRPRLATIWRPARPRRGRWVVWMGYDRGGVREAATVAYTRSRLEAIRIGRDWVVGSR